jgi:hypothetical protein
MSDILSKTKEILNLSRLMLQAAEASEWNSVHAYEKQLQIILNDLNLCEKLDVEISGDIAEDLEKSAELNQRIVDLGLNVKTELAKIRNTVQRGRKAALAYTR